MQLPSKGLSLGAGAGAWPSSPIELASRTGILGLHFLSPVQRSPAARVVMSEAEDYTCVNAWGPNPKMTNIFDPRVVQSCDGCCQLSSCCDNCCWRLCSSET